MNVAAKPPSSFKLEAVHPDPSQAHKMPYAPAIKIVGACDLMFLSGATSSPLYHNHPHQDHEHVHPHSIEEQTRNAMNAIQSILESVGASWKDVIKVTKYLTDFREADAMHKTMHAYFGDWLPASTTVCINQLSSPGARIELDMIVALPKRGGEVSGARSTIGRTTPPLRSAPSAPAWPSSPPAPWTSSGLFGLEARRHRAVLARQDLVVLDVERAQPSLLAHGQRDEVADLDQLRLAEVLVQPRPEFLVDRQVPGDRLGVGEGGLLLVAVMRRASKLIRSLVWSSTTAPALAALIERWLPQNSHSTERDT